MMTATFGAAVALASAFIGGLFGHFLAERKSRNDEIAKLRLEAYCDFIRAASHLVAARRSGRTKDDLSELSAVNDAKVRICISADGSVVEAMERFWMQGGTLEKEQEVLAFTQLCQAMRASLGNQRLRQDIHLSDVLFKLEPATYSYRGSRSYD